MTTYNKHLSEPWFSLIKLKIKTCEGRLNKDDFANMKKNDIIVFTNNDFDLKRSFSVKIKHIRHYNTFRDYLVKETLEKCLPGIDTIENGLSVYYKYFTKEDENKYKIVAIRVKCIANQ